MLGVGGGEGAGGREETTDIFDAWEGRGDEVLTVGRLRTDSRSAAQRDRAKILEDAARQRASLFSVPRSPECLAPHGRRKTPRDVGEQNRLCKRSIWNVLEDATTALRQDFLFLMPACFAC